MGSNSFEFWKAPFVSASTADVTTSLKVCHSIKIAPLYLYLYLLAGVFASLKYSAILLRALDSTRYAASESTISCMSLA